MREQCPSPKPECLDRGICFIDTNHLYWPKSRYLGKLATAFRNLPQHTEQLPRCEHDNWHATTVPPIRPSAEFMIETLREAGL